MNKVNKVETIRAKLKDRNVQAVARQSGLSPGTLYKLKRGHINPTYKTIKKLEHYLDIQSAAEQTKGN